MASVNEELLQFISACAQVYQLDVILWPGSHYKDVMIKMTYNFWREIIGLSDSMLSVHCSMTESVTNKNMLSFSGLIPCKHLQDNPVKVMTVESSKSALQGLLKSSLINFYDLLGDS